MVNSAEVKSLLVRLHDAIQSGSGSVMANQVSFAQSLGESLLPLPIVAKDKATDVTTVVAPKGEAAPLAAIEDKTPVDAVLKSEPEVLKSAEAPGIPALPQIVQQRPQIKDSKVEETTAVPATNAVTETNVIAEKPTAKPAGLFIEVKDKAVVTCIRKSSTHLLCTLCAKKNAPSDEGALSDWTAFLFKISNLSSFP